MHRLTGGRFTLGLGRGFDMLFDVMGVPRVTMAQLEDFMGIMRRLWHGEAVMGHDGPAGRYPYLNQDPRFDEDIPILLTAIGEQTLEFSGTRRGRGGAAHVLHRRDAGQQRRRGAPRRGAGRPSRGIGARLVRARDHRRPHRRGPAAEEARRPARHLPPGLRRPARPRERMGSRGARRVPRRRGRAGRRRRARRARDAGPARVTSRRCCPTSGSPRPRPDRRPSARHASSTSSTPAPTA